MGTTVDDTGESLVRVCRTYNPCSASGVLHVKSGKECSGCTRQTAEIIRRLVLATDNLSRSFKVESSVLNTRSVAYGELTVASLAGSVYNDAARKLAPVALDVLANPVHFPLQCTATTHSRLNQAVAEERHIRIGVGRCLDGEGVCRVLVVATGCGERTSGHHELAHRAESGL